MSFHADRNSKFEVEALYVLRLMIKIERGCECLEEDLQRAENKKRTSCPFISKLYATKA